MGSPGSFSEAIQRGVRSAERAFLDTCTLVDAGDFSINPAFLAQPATVVADTVKPRVFRSKLHKNGSPTGAPSVLNEQGEETKTDTQYHVDTLEVSTNIPRKNPILGHALALLGLACEQSQVRLNIRIGTQKTDPPLNMKTAPQEGKQMGVLMSYVANFCGLPADGKFVGNSTSDFMGNKICAHIIAETNLIKYSEGSDVQKIHIKQLPKNLAQELTGGIYVALFKKWFATYVKVVERNIDVLYKSVCQNKSSIPKAYRTGYTPDERKEFRKTMPKRHKLKEIRSVMSGTEFRMFINSDRANVSLGDNAPSDWEGSMDFNGSEALLKRYRPIKSKRFSDEAFLRKDLVKFQQSLISYETKIPNHSGIKTMLKVIDDIIYTVFTGYGLTSIYKRMDAMNKEKKRIRNNLLRTLKGRRATQSELNDAYKDVVNLSVTRTRLVDADTSRYQCEICLALIATCDSSSPQGRKLVAFMSDEGNFTVVDGRHWLSFVNVPEEDRKVFAEMFATAVEQTTLMQDISGLRAYCDSSEFTLEEEDDDEGDASS